MKVTVQKAAPHLKAAPEATLLVTQTPWERDLESIRALRGPVVQPIVVEGQSAWFVRKFSKNDLMLLGILMNNEGFTLVDIEESEGRKAFHIALLFLGVCKGYPQAAHNAIPSAR